VVSPLQKRSVSTKYTSALSQVNLSSAVFTVVYVTDAVFVDTLFVTEALTVTESAAVVENADTGIESLFAVKLLYEYVFVVFCVVLVTVTVAAEIVLYPSVSVTITLPLREMAVPVTGFIVTVGATGSGTVVGSEL